MDWRQGYGYQYWMARHGFRGDGAHGQFCVVVPDHDLVVATTACVEDMQQVLDAMWERLLPALDQPDDGGYAAETRLGERLSALALPVVAPMDDGPPSQVTFTVAASDDDTSPPLVPGATVTVTPDALNWVITIDSAPQSLHLTLVCARDRWAEGTLPGPGADRRAGGIPSPGPTPVVCRGGWTGPGTFEADVVLIETPHRIRLRGNGTHLTARWNAPPLTGSRLETQVGYQEPSES